MAGAAKRSKKADTTPARSRYWTSSKLQLHKVAHVIRHNRVRVDSHADPANAKARHAMETRPRTQSEATEYWTKNRTRRTK